MQVIKNYFKVVASCGILLLVGCNQPQPSQQPIQNKTEAKVEVTETQTTIQNNKTSGNNNTSSSNEASSKTENTHSTNNTDNTNTTSSAENTNNNSNNKDESLVIYTVGADSMYPPYDINNEDGNPSGFDIEILQAIAEYQKFDLEIVPKKWAALLEGIETGKYDIAVGGFAAMDVSEQTKKYYTLSKPYIFARDAIGYVNEDLKVSTFEDLKDYSVSTMRNTSWVTDLTELKGGSDGITQAKTGFLAITNLLNKSVETTLNDRGVLLYYANSLPEAGIKVVGSGEYFESYDLVILTKTEIAGLNDKINQGLKTIIENGTYKDIYLKWFGMEPEAMPVIN